MAGIRIAAVDCDRDLLEAFAASARQQECSRTANHRRRSDQWRRFVAVHTTAPLALKNAVADRSSQADAQHMLPSSSECEVAATCSGVDILFRDDALADEAVVIDA
jgi:hypothetical protein